jgi:hypothetical protein
MEVRATTKPRRAGFRCTARGRIRPAAVLQKDSVPFRNACSTGRGLSRFGERNKKTAGPLRRRRFDFEIFASA